MGWCILHVSVARFLCRDYSTGSLAGINEVEVKQRLTALLFRIGWRCIGLAYLATLFAFPYPPGPLCYQPSYTGLFTTFSVRIAMASSNEETDIELGVSNGTNFTALPNTRGVVARRISSFLRYYQSRSGAGAHEKKIDSKMKSQIQSMFLLHQLKSKKKRC